MTKPIDIPAIRLHVKASLGIDAQVALPQGQSHYLVRVMRQPVGAQVALFNGEDGEWVAELEDAHAKSARLRVLHQTKPPRAEPDIWLVCSPLRQGKTEMLVQKATEMGVSRIQLWRMAHSVAKEANLERLEAVAIEAAEQCERLTVPVVEPLKPFAQGLQAWDTARVLIYGHESGEGQPIATVLQPLAGRPLALMVGPEGGFSAQEFTQLAAKPWAAPVGLGPRILKADTAVIAALACIQSICGDWHDAPSFRTPSHTGN